MLVASFMAHLMVLICYFFWGGLNGSSKLSAGHLETGHKVGNVSIGG